MIRKPKIIGQVAGILLLTLSLCLIGQQIWLSWPQISALRLQPGPAAGAFLLACLNLLLTALLWHTILAGLGTTLALRVALPIWFVAQTARYVPGNVWHLFGRVYLMQQAGVAAQTTSQSLFIELLQTILAGLCVALLSLPFWQAQKYGGWFLLLFPLLICVLWPSLLHQPLAWASHLFGRKLEVGKIEGQKLYLLLAGYGFSWLLHGGSIFLLAIALQPLPFTTFPAITGIFALAWIIGFLSFITPSGLGVREGALSYLLSSVMPLPQALALTLLSRVWLTAADLCCTTFAFCWKKR